MKRAHVSVIFSLSLLLAPAGAIRGQGEFGFDSASGFKGQSISFNLTMGADGEVQGLQAAFEWNGAQLKGENLTPLASIAAADIIVPRVADSFMVLGVVMNADATGNNVIPPGEGIDIARVQVKALGPSGDTEESVAIHFVDGKYNTSELGQVPLDNLIVVGGLSIGVADGFVLNDGTVRLLPPPEGVYTVQNTSAFFGATAKVPVILGNSKPVQGYVMAVKVDAGATLTGIEPGAVAATADFSDVDVFPGQNGGTLGVVMELQAPFNPNNVIPAGASNEIARLVLTSPAITSSADCNKTATVGIHFVDGQLGDPLKENVIVIGGQSKAPQLTDGALSLSADKSADPCGAPPKQGLALGACTLGDDQLPDPITVTRGTAAHPSAFGLGLYYRSPEDDVADEAAQTDHVQGVSMAVCYDARCIVCDETYSITGTITEAVGAEFVNVHCDNVQEPDDPGELIVGILVDALPPFDGQDLPPTNDYLLLLCVNFHVNPSGDCTLCKSTKIFFCDGADGRGSVPIRNLMSVMNQSVSPQLDDTAGMLTVRAEPTFIRGDCNGSDHGGLAVDIADAAAVISYLFLTGTWKYAPPCLDACDANDDGRVDLADSVYILRYLFKFDKAPKAPFPEAGVDPTYDKLSCDAGSDCPVIIP